VSAMMPPECRRNGFSGGEGATLAREQWRGGLGPRDCPAALLWLIAYAASPARAQAIMVKGSENEKNLAWEAQQQAKASQLKAASLLGAAGLDGAAVGPCVLHVANLDAAIGEADFMQVGWRPCSAWTPAKGPTLRLQQRGLRHTVMRGRLRCMAQCEGEHVSP
jgi:hypothetical protein